MSEVDLIPEATPSTPASGHSLLYVGSDKKHRMIDDAGLISWCTEMSSSILTADTGNQTSTTEAIISPTLTVKANTVQIGTTFRLKLYTSCAAGATAQTTPGFVYRVRWGGVTGTIICNANNVITPATSLAATPGYVEAFITIRTIGASGTAKGGIFVVDPRIVREATTVGIYSRVGKSGGAVTINTTVDNDLVVTLVGTIADASAITFGESGMWEMAKS